MDWAETVRKIKRGEEEVYGEIIDDCSGYLATVINSVYVLNAHDTEDIIAETILALWKNAKKLREDLNFKSYLAKIARNKTVDFVRKKRVEMVELDITLLVSPDVETDLLYKELVEFINAKIGEAREPDRTILILKYKQGLKNSEIADKLNINPNVVNIRLSRQRARLKKMLSGMGV